jgi:hypothetical protein
VVVVDKVNQVIRNNELPAINGGFIIHLLVETISLRSYISPSSTSLRG